MTLISKRGANGGAVGPRNHSLQKKGNRCPSPSKNVRTKEVLRTKESGSSQKGWGPLGGGGTDRELPQRVGPYFTKKRGPWKDARFNGGGIFIEKNSGRESSDDADQG